MSRWFRVYDELIDDPKIQRLAPELFKVLMNLWCLTSQNGGNLPRGDDMAFKLRLPPQRLSRILTELRGAGLLEEDQNGVRPHNWNRRQYKSDDSYQRVKRFRDRNRNAAVTLDETFHPPLLKRRETENETPPDTDTETDTERKKDSRSIAGAMRPDASQEFQEFWKEYPKRDGANPKAPAIKKLLSALKSGVPLEAIIAGARRYRSECQDKKIIGTPYVAQAVTWLNQQRWGDYQPQGPPAARASKPPSPLDLELIAEYQNGHGRTREDHRQDRQPEGQRMAPIGFRPRFEDG